jgi:hypothetical protein
MQMQKNAANDARKKAWANLSSGIKAELNDAAIQIQNLASSSPNKVFIEVALNKLKQISEPERKDIESTIKKVLRYVKSEDSEERNQLLIWLQNYRNLNTERYDSHLYSQSKWSIHKINPIPVAYDSNAPLVDGREVLQANWDVQLGNKHEVVIFGEDVGNIGGVNQTYAGLQAKYGENRIFDTGIREATIIGQGIGLALRGFRPVAEIQYLDYLAYAIQVLTDDLACLHYRTKGGQKSTHDHCHSRTSLRRCLAFWITDAIYFRIYERNSCSGT